MEYNFNRRIDRRGTYSAKYNNAAHGVPEDALPMWVADMDFETPPCVSEALKKRVDHGIYGYSEPDAKYFEIVQNWFKDRFGWKTESEWIQIAPGVVNAIYIAVRALSEPGDGVLIQQPVYYPFVSAVKNNKRELLINKLIYEGLRYEIDFEDFENKAKRAKIFILCSPHNPVGRVWTEGELRRIGEICLKHGVYVISDEIHADFVYPGNRHHVFAGLSEAFADIAVTCTAPSKTFNLAGIPHSNIFISNKNIRDKFNCEYEISGIGMNGVMGIIACGAAYENGGGWLDALIGYLRGNVDCLRGFLQNRIPGIKLVEPEGTYLAWLDCAALGLPPDKLEDLILNGAKVWLSRGEAFGAGGEGFRRMNLGCPRSVLQEALERIEKSVLRYAAIRTDC